MVTERDPTALVRTGYVVKAHGIRGEIKVHPDPGLLEGLCACREIFLADPVTGERRSYGVSRCRPQGKLAIIQLEGLSDRTTAEGLAGLDLLVDRATLPELPEGEFYHHELIGLRAETDKGRELGRVEDIFTTPGHDILVIRARGREYLVPLNSEFVRKSRERDDTLIINEMPGLLEIND